MIEIFSSKLFRYLAVPLITTILGILIKSVSKKDDSIWFVKDDFAFGLNMSVAAILLFLMNCVTIAEKSQVDSTFLNQTKDFLINSSWIITGLTFGLWGISTIVRKLGWEKKTVGSAITYDLKIFWGIIIPDAYGLITLIIVVSLIGN